MKNFVTIIKEGISHILELTPIGEKKERKPQEANINLSYFHGKDNVETNLDWEIRYNNNLKGSLLQNLMALTLIQRKTKAKAS